MPDFRVNQKIQSSNGPGTVQGVMYEDGTQLILVRHIVAEMTAKTAGECLTPDPLISGLWRYEVHELQPLNEKVRA